MIRDDLMIEFFDNRSRVYSRQTIRWYRMSDILDTGASKPFMSKSYYLCCKSLQSLPKFALKMQRIQVGNGQYVNVLFVIPIILELSGIDLRYTC